MSRKKLKDITDKNAKRVLQDKEELDSLKNALSVCLKFCNNHLFCRNCPLSEKIKNINGYADYKCAMTRLVPFNYDTILCALNKEED